MVRDGEVESCLKRTRHPPNDHCGQVGRALCPYLLVLGVQVRQHYMGFRPCLFPSGSVGVCSPVVSGSHAHVIRPSIWPAPPSLPPSPDVGGEIDLQ